MKFAKIIFLLAVVGFLQLLLSDMAGKNGGILKSIKKEV